MLASVSPEEVDRVVATFDLRHADDHAARLVDRDPGLRIGDVEIGIGPVHSAGSTVHELVPLEAILEIELLLARHHEPTEQVDVGVADVLIGNACGLRLSIRRYSRADEGE
jgi:hypothetical protein